MNVQPCLGRSTRADPIRILLVSPLPPPPGGIQTWTEILLERGLPPPFEVELVDTKVTRRHQDVPPRLNRQEVQRFLSILRQIRLSLRSNRFSIMHLNCSLTNTATPRNLLSTMIARCAGVPYAMHLHGTFDLPTGSSVVSRLYRTAYRTMFNGAGSILALGVPSYKAIRQLGDFGYKTTPLLPNFVDFRSIPVMTPHAKGRGAPMSVVFSGALTVGKGIHTVVKIAERLADVRFQLIGDGPPESRVALLQRISECGLDGRVKVLGPVTYGEVLARLTMSDVFLFPSAFKFEAFPFSVLEAMAVGLPVVASPVGAIPEMIDVPDGGYLFAPDDVAGYVGALSSLRNSPAMRRRMGQHNREKAMREYDYDVVVDQLCGIYRGVLAGRPGRGDGNVRSDS